MTIGDRFSGMLGRPAVKVLGVSVVAAMLAAGCGGGAETSSGADLSDADFTVGSKDFTEQLVLGYITAGALEAAGASVEDQVGLSGTDATRQALIGGDIDMYWEYTGTIWINHLGNTEPIADEQEQYTAARDADLEENQLQLLETPAPFNNTYALAVRSEAVEDLGVTSLSDIGTLIEERPEEATVCVESEFNSRDDGLPGMEEAYGYEFPNDNVSLFDTGVVYDRTDSGDPCNFGEVFTTDGRIAALDLTVLEDDMNFFPNYNPVLEVRSETYEQYGEQLDTLFTPIAEALTDEEMSAMNARVDVDGELPEDVADEWLEENGFVE
ncbi:glycine betaine ABC transporter substrate-binding protein [Rubrobacter indicoceani]|uniref:glycine betaine ABC transporter substrate-binding protein n=1 Tax=Rubrobacter indicoceani TaxID=2051957 RepID=UPI0019698879|nr:glycine betaine ABC transporter substrate-binding protein [Rubrobacter indicoceani]